MNKIKNNYKVKQGKTYGLLICDDKDKSVEYKVKIDIGDLPRVISHPDKWYYCKKKDGKGVRVASSSKERGDVALRRFLLACSGNIGVSNINGDPLDCRKANLKCVPWKKSDKAKAAEKK